MRTTLYAAFAVILPVALGLGLVYLTSVGRIVGYTALMGTMAIVTAMVAGIHLRDAAMPGGMAETGR